MVIPQHVAIILDGNGRWAKSKGMPRNYGHSRGAKNLEVICEDAWNMGIKYLTVYLFSTENWKRSKEEVDGLMRLFRSYTKTCIKTAQKNNMKVRLLGDPTALDPDLQESLKKLEESSKDNTGLNFQIAVGRVHRLVEHALEFELSNLLLDFLDVLTHGFNRVPVFFGHREFEKLGSIVDARGELVEAADDVVEELLFLAHFLSMLGIVPEIRVLNLAVDFFETARFAIDVKDTPEVRSDGA